jgi:hypothetical protein
VNVEDLSEHELRVLHEHYARLARRAKETSALTDSHSVDEAERRHVRKARSRDRLRGR